MKWLLFFLIGANAAVFIWYMAGPAQEKIALPQTFTNERAVVPLVLLSKIDRGKLRLRPGVSEERVSQAAVQASREAPTGGAVANAKCFSIEPVPSENKRGRLLQWLNGHGGTSKLRNHKWREQVVYWVFFPPLETLEKAFVQVDDMLAKGIENVSVIRRGNMANAISLGIYNRKTYLERRLTELRNLGYEPGVLPRYRRKKTTWYEVKFDRTDFEFPRKQFSRHFPAAFVRETACAVTGVPRVKASGLSTISRVPKYGDVPDETMRAKRVGG